MHCTNGPLLCHSSANDAPKGEAQATRRYTIPRDSLSAALATGENGAIGMVETIHELTDLFDDFDEDGGNDLVANALPVPPPPAPFSHLCGISCVHGS
jgi:hypothetical protein